MKTFLSGPEALSVLVAVAGLGIIVAESISSAQGDRYPADLWEQLDREHIRIAVRWSLAMTTPLTVVSRPITAMG